MFPTLHPQNIPLVSLEIYDIIRLIIMQIVSQLLFSSINKDIKIFNIVFLLSTLFLSIGLIVFWMFIYKHIPIEKILSYLVIEEKHIKDSKDNK